MKQSRRRKVHLILAWAYWLLLPMAGYLVVFEEKLWARIATFAILLISVETASTTHLSAAAADTPMEAE